MVNPNRPDISNRLIDLGGKIQHLESVPLLGRTYLNLEQALHGSSSPAYVRARWEKVYELVDEDGHETTMPFIEADPTADKLSGFIQRRKKEVAIVSAGRLVIDNIIEQNPDARAAVAFTYRNKTRAGILPDGVEDYGRFLDEYTAALRVGAENFMASPGVWLPIEKTLVAPRDAAIVAQHLSVDKLGMPQYVPGTPLV
jgi:hypothetical protein